MTSVSERSISKRTLIAIAYPEEHRAAEVLATLKQLRSEVLIDLDEAFYVTKDQKGDIKVYHSAHITRKGNGWDALGGLLIGALLFMPVAGLLVGAATGAMATKLVDLGIDDQCVKELNSQLQLNNSAIFILVRKVSPDIVLAALRP
jgi:uncharacterized membrane protein